MMSYIYLTIIIIILFFILETIYYKLRNPYWSKQPVYHNYNIFIKMFNNISNPKIINILPQPKDKYVNTDSINILTLEDKDTKEKLTNFLINNYIQTESINYLPTLDHINTNFSCVEKDSYCSFMYGNILHQYNEIKEELKIIGSITSKPLEIYYQNNKLDTYYVDFLCISLENRKLYNVPKLIQTHKYFVDNKKGKANIYFFKNESSQNFNIVPYVKTKNYVFNILKWKTPPSIGNIELVKMNKNTLSCLIDNLYNYDNFDVYIHINIQTIINMINNNDLHIYILKTPDRLLGIYIFKKTYTRYKNHNIIETISCMRLSNCKENTFIKGFHNAAYLCCKEFKYKYIIIENISDNYIFLYEILKSQNFDMYYENSYYFYNYLTKPIDYKNCFLLF